MIEHLGFSDAAYTSLYSKYYAVNNWSPTHFMGQLTCLAPQFYLVKFCIRLFTVMEATLWGVALFPLCSDEAVEFEHGERSGERGERCSDLMLSNSCSHSSIEGCRLCPLAGSSLIFLPGFCRCKAIEKAAYVGKRPGYLLTIYICML